MKHLVIAITLGIILVILATWGRPTNAASGNRTLFVNWNAIRGSNNGSSWDNAYLYLQDALAEANSGDEIWVAKGVYYPDEGIGQMDNNRASTFSLLENGVAIYGGFAGGEETRDERDWKSNFTVLSGDLEQNDGVDSNHVVTNTANITGANAYHVVSSSSGITKTTILDGFTITAGNANSNDNPFDERGGGMINDAGSPAVINTTFSGNRAGYGGGMLNNASSPSLKDVIFSGNYALFHGAGMDNYESSKPALLDVAFVNNHAEDDGGGMHNNNSTPTLTNVIFSGNYATDGGGMHNWMSDPSLTNVTFSGNRAEWDGGGMHNWTSAPSLTNVTFSGNWAFWNGGGMRNYESSSPNLVNVTFSGNKGRYGGGIQNKASSPTLVNCILWGDTWSEIDNNVGTPTVAYSDIQGGYDGTGNLNIDPLFIAPITATVAPTTAGNYRLSSKSPLIDKGNNDSISDAVAADLDGNQRIVNGDGIGAAVVDMGAYEVQSGQLYLPLVVRQK